MFTRRFDVRCAHCGDGVDLTRLHIQVKDNFRVVAVYHADRECSPQGGNTSETYWVFPALTPNGVTQHVPV
jgi:hypothetical protein